MGTLTNADFYFYKHYMLQSQTARDELASASLSKQQWKDILQAIEDWYTADRLTVKGDMDTAAGVTLSNPLAKEFEKAYVARKDSIL